MIRVACDNVTIIHDQLPILAKNVNRILYEIYYHTLSMISHFLIQAVIKVYCFTQLINTAVRTSLSQKLP